MNIPFKRKVESNVWDHNLLVLLKWKKVYRLDNSCINSKNGFVQYF